jgi:hypothetical protein
LRGNQRSRQRRGCNRHDCPTDNRG